MRLADLAKKLNAQLYGDKNIIINKVSSIYSAQTNEITFLSNSRYKKQLASCKASAVVLTKKDLPYCQSAALVVKNPYLSYARIAQLMDTTPLPERKITATSVISPTVTLGNNVAIGAHAVIEKGVFLGDNTIIGPGCFIGKFSRIGSGTRLWANVTIYHTVEIGKHCLVHSGTVIGSDGFGYVNENKQWIKIPQLGTVIIGNYVQIGACTTIDRGALDNTCIKNNVIIDNQCHIAHNVVIHSNTAIAGGVIIAGSVNIGNNCQIGGGSVLNGHIKISDKVIITGMSMVMRSIKKPGIYSSGIPVQSNQVWRKTTALIMNINKIKNRLKSIEQKIKKNNNE